MTASSSVSFVESECRESTCIHNIQQKKLDSKMVCRQRVNKCLVTVWLHRPCIKDSVTGCLRILC